MAPKMQPKVLEWYGDVSARRVDLVGDYAGSELFVIHGESLLLRCFEDCSLDYLDGFQLLHAVYLVERFLSNLKDRKCNFHLAFFETTRDLCIPPDSDSASRYKYILTRSVVIRHLEECSKKNEHQGIAVQRFNDLQDISFQTYFAASGAYFIMIHDGATTKDFRPTVLNSDGSVEPEDEIQVPIVQQKVRFRGMISTVLKSGSNVALINGLAFHDTKVMVDILEGRRQYVRMEGQTDLPSSEVMTPSSAELHDSGLSLVDVQSMTMSLQQRESACNCGELPANNICLTSRDRYSILALSSLHAEPFPEKLWKSYLLHVAAIGSLPLCARRLKITNYSEALTADAFSVLGEICLKISEMLDNNEYYQVISENTAGDIVDLIDGRLFMACLLDDTQQVFGLHGFKDRFEILAWALCKTTGHHIRKTQWQTLRCANGSSVAPLTTAEHRVLPFSNEVFDRHLLPIKIVTGQEQKVTAETGRIFQEVTHWHSAKRPLSQKAVVAVKPWIKKRLDRKHHHYMADMQRYAASLTNANGGLLEPETIIVDKDSKATPSSRSKHFQSNAGTPSKTKTPNAAAKKGNKQARLDVMAANAASKQDELAKKVNQGWDTFRKGLEKETDSVEKYKRVLAYLLRLSDAKREVIGAEVQFHLICFLVEKIAAVDSKSLQPGLRALLWNSLRKLTGDKFLTVEIAERLPQIIKFLDLPEIEVQKPGLHKKMVFDPELKLPPKQAQKQVDRGLMFQLLHCGPYLDRNLNSAPDPRVPFEPDGWQRYVLDEVDARRSLFVVAPTSAGKTFISFHAMNNVLRESDDGILVYVAPTKALVLQVAAEVQARFSKSYRYPGKCLWAVHTRDYRVNNPQGCQILVTVPQILQILLLSPSNAKTWSPRIRYIIFDEIHSIGQAEDGVVWEQLLLLAPCPIIALSATVGNPATFSGWLAETQNSLGNKLVTVQHHHRFNDLRKFIYTPPTHHRFQGLKKSTSFGVLGLDDLEGFEFLHPISSLVNRSRGIPPDLSLEARDCLSLYQAMCEHQTEQYPVGANLSPEQSLPSKIVRKKDIVKWEHGLKALLQEWMLDPNSPFDLVVQYLSPPRRAANRADSKAVHENQDDSIIDRDDLCQTTLPLLCKLQERGALPAILFNYDRIACERICQALTQQLEKAEAEYKQSSETWKRKVQNHEQRKAMQAAKASNQRDAKKAGKKSSQNDKDAKLERDLASMDSGSDVADGFDPEAPVDGYHFADGRLLSDNELSDHLHSLTVMGLPPWLNLGIQRGIGIHHAGMNRKYRQVVEILFRKGFLRVVIATGTLALGINMPCVTVVFSGDSVYLTALNYRQAAGRAGRRGFDLLGNVVFQGVSNDKACRLLSSRLPDLNGHFPITTTLILRLFTLLQESNTPFARRAIDSMLSQPRLYLNGPSFKEQVLHHLRFSIEYLRRQDLLSSQGVPINFAGLTSHLYYTENSSFAFNALIKGGYFHQLCAGIYKKESEVLRNMMLVLSHIFCRRVCREADAEYKERVKRSPSIVFLPALPPRAVAILRAHNADTRKVFTSYVHTFVEQHLEEKEDCILPLSGLRVGGEDKSLRLQSSLQLTKIRSAFVALSGHGDENIDSIADLCHTVRQGVFLEEAVIPHIKLHPEESSTPLNAYLYDFYMHGDTTTLEKANHIRKADVWYYLNDFSLVLATIVASLANFLKISETDISQESVMGEGDRDDDRREDQANDDGPEEDEEQESDRLAGTLSEMDINIPDKQGTPTRASPSKKTAVADSWDADMSDDDEASEAKVENEIDAAALGAFAKDTRSKVQIEKGFLNIHRSFVRLSHEFNTKYRKIFA